MAPFNGVMFMFSAALQLVVEVFCEIVQKNNLQITEQCLNILDCSLMYYQISFCIWNSWLERA